MLIRQGQLNLRFLVAAMVFSSKQKSLFVLSATVSAGIVVLYYIKRQHLYKLLWKWKIQRKISSMNKDIQVINDPEGWNFVQGRVMSEIDEVRALGFDCEWVHVKKSRHPVSLLQLATHSGLCLLIRLCTMDNIPDSLNRILCDESILKVGVDPLRDSSLLFHDYNIEVSGCVDLRYLALEHQSQGNRQKTSLGLSALAKQYLGKDLNKDYKIRSSNWESESLSIRQENYAAEDALCGLQVLMVLTGHLWNPATLGLFHIFSMESSVMEMNAGMQQMTKRFVGLRYFKSSQSASDFSCDRRDKAIAALSRTSLKNRFRAYVTRKTPLYHNSMLYAPDDQPLCTCDPKKALWYVEKGLGKIITEDPLLVKLNFEPAGRPQKEGGDGQFYLQERFNICAVCGKEDSYIRKNIIPHEYRKYFPVVLKAHQSHDVLLLCTHCHQLSNLKDSILRYQLAEECSAPIASETDIKARLDPNLKAIQKAASALQRQLKDLPPGRVEELQNILKKHYGVDCLSGDLISEATKIDANIINDQYVPHGLRVYEVYKKIGVIHLEIRWRQNFLDSMKPNYLPTGWSVDHNHKKLRLKMSRLPEGDPLREEYHICLVGTEGKIHVPYVPSGPKRYYDSEGRVIKEPSSGEDMFMQEIYEESGSKESSPDLS